MNGALWSRCGALPDYDHTMPPLSCIHVPTRHGVGRWWSETCFAAGWDWQGRVALGAGASAVTGIIRPAAFVAILPSPTDLRKHPGRG